MSSLVNDTLKEQLNCCAAATASSIDLKSDEGALTKECLFEGGILAYQNQLIQEYIPNGELLSEGRVSDATLDLSAFSSFGHLMGAVFINNTLVGVLPEADYATIDDLLDAYVTAIATGGSGYSAVNNGNSTITVYAPPNSGSGANGFVINIIINPDWVATDYDISAASGLTPLGLRQMQHVNLVGNMTGDTVIAVENTNADPTLTGDYVFRLSNHVYVDNIHVFSSSIPGSGAHGITPRPVPMALSQTEIITASPSGFNGWGMNSSLAHVNTYSALFDTKMALYNPTDNCTYFARVASNLLTRLDTNNVMTSVSAQMNQEPPFRNMMEIDGSNGNIWVCGSTDVTIINTSLAIVTTWSPVSKPISVTWMSSVSLMAVLLDTGAILTYDSSGSIVDNPFATIATASAVFYSTVFNLLFVSKPLVLTLLKMDGTTLTTISTNSAIFTEDILNATIITHRGAGPNITYVNFGNDGEEIFSGALENGTPDVFMDESMQCIAETRMNSLVQHVKSECGCVDCGATTTSAEIPINPPTSLSYPVYFGNSIETALDATQIQSDLGVVMATTFAGVFDFVADPGTYKFFAYPQQWGTPSRFHDLIGGLDVVMDPAGPYSVTINLMIYTVYRTFNILGGVQQWEVEL